MNGSLPGEPVERVEIGLKGAPLTGLYIREDVHMTCNIIMTPFVKKTLKESHAALIERLKLKAELASAMYSVSHRASDSISSVDTVDSSKNLSVYSAWDSRHQRTSSHCSTAASSVSSRTTSPPPPASYKKNMVVNPPTPPYNPMASSLWSQPQPPQSTTTLASLLHPRRSLQNYSRPQTALVPEPLRIPRPMQGFSHQIEQNKPRPTSYNPSPRRKFSYDSTSSTENYLSTSPTTTKRNNDGGHMGIQIPIRMVEQHIQLQSQEYRQQPTSRPPPPRQQQKQNTHHNRYKEHHPDYPHMSPYTNGDDDHDKEDRRQEEAEVVVNDNDSGYADELPPTKALGATLNGPFIASFDDFHLRFP